MELEQQTVEKILNYLSTKPYREVSGLIGEVQLQIKKDASKKK